MTLYEMRGRQDKNGVGDNGPGLKGHHRMARIEQGEPLSEFVRFWSLIPDP